MAVSLETGLRDRNKQQKLERIRTAAWQLFQEKGFELTTTREIAERANVGTGTLFLYVKDKQDLLLLIFREAIEETINEAFADLPEDLTLADELVYIFGFFFRLYNQNITLARVYIKALLFHEEEGYWQKANEQIVCFLKMLAGRLEQVKLRGEIAPSLDVALASRNFFALYYATLTTWLNGLIEFTEIDNFLKQSFELQIQGLLPNKGLRTEKG